MNPATRMIEGDRSLSLCRQWSRRQIQLPALPAPDPSRRAGLLKVANSKAQDLRRVRHLVISRTHHQDEPRSGARNEDRVVLQEAGWIVWAIDLAVVNQPKHSRPRRRESFSRDSFSRDSAFEEQGQRPRPPLQKNTPRPSSRRGRRWLLSTI